MLSISTHQRGVITRSARFSYVNNRVGKTIHRSRPTTVVQSSERDPEEPSKVPEQKQETVVESPVAKSRPVDANPDPSVVKGQRTAIWTGAVSIIFGIAYLALVQFMDMRGSELLPPPPEAYMQ